MEDRDEQGYKYNYYARKQDPENTPVFWRRKDYPDVVYRTEEIKLRAIAREILQLSCPRTTDPGGHHLGGAFRARLEPPARRAAAPPDPGDAASAQTWFDKNKREEDGRQVPELQYLNAPLDDLDLTAMRKMCRDLEMSFNPEEAGKPGALCSSCWSCSRSMASGWPRCCKAGIPHQVLNARKHTEESQIIAGAGAFGAVTIATNMAGRGVDIKLGGELAEEIISAVNRVLRRAGYEDPYDMTMDERRQALLKHHRRRLWHLRLRGATIS